MGKSTRAPILAAGGIVIRHDPKPRVAIVQRRRDRAWVLPKGKLKPNEKPIAAAKREVMEETGCDVRVHEFLGVISHPAGRGPKITHFWRMQVVGDSNGTLMSDIKAVEWLPLAAATERLSLPHEQSFLRHIGPRAVRRAMRKAPSRQPLPAIAEPPFDTEPSIVFPDPEPIHSGAQSRQNALVRLIRRFFGQRSDAA
jgi:8-oxo-dGTP diphosphatase